MTAVHTDTCHVQNTLVKIVNTLDDVMSGNAMSSTSLSLPVVKKLAGATLTESPYRPGRNLNTAAQFITANENTT